MKHYTNTSNPVDFPKLSAVDRLWGKALDRAVPDTYSSLTWTQVERIKAVFAELMIAEFSDVVKQTANELAEFYTRQGCSEEEVLMRVNGALVVLGHIRERFKD